MTDIPQLGVRGFDHELDDRGAVADAPILRPEDRGGSARYRVASTIGLMVVAAYLFLITGVLVRSSYDTWAAFVLAPVFFMLSAPLLRRMLTKVEPDPWIHKVVIAGLGAKLVGGFARFAANEFFLGHADAATYYRFGSGIAAEFRSFVFGGPAYQEAITNYTGTRFIRLVTGLVYVVTGSTHLGGYIVFSFMSFWGLYLFYRAYCIAMPDGLRRRYAVLLFFLPSMVFWPSSIGKEAWMITMLGLGSYGMARLLAQQRFGYTAILPAMAGMGIVRPHVAAIFGAALGAGLVLRRTKGGIGIGTGKKILGLLLLAVVAGLLVNQLQSFFELESGLDAQQVFEETNRRSSSGDSQFEGAQPTSLAELPWALVTVMFRPFLFEARSLGELLTALEGTILIALFAWNAPRLARLPSLLLSRPYVGYAFVYSLIFAFAFSAINNYGILARQRTQLFPIVVILVTAPYQSSLRTRKDLVAPFDGGDHGESTGGRRAAGDRVAAGEQTPGEEADGQERRVRLPFTSSDNRMHRWHPELTAQAIEADHGDQGP